MKKIFLTTLLIAAAVSASAEITDCLSVVYKGGDVASLPLSSVRRIDLSASQLVISSYGNDPLEISIAELKRLEFGEADLTSLTDAELAQLGFGITASDVEITNAPANAQVRIYNVSGALVAQAVCSPQGDATINLSHLPTGAYIIAIDNFTKKFIKR